ERHGPNDGVRDVRIVQKPDELVECPLDIRFTHEEPCRLCDPVPETRLAIRIEPLPAHSPPSQPWSRIASTGAPRVSQPPRPRRVVGVGAEDVLEAALGDLVERPEGQPRHLVSLGYRRGGEAHAGLEGADA